MTRTIWKFPIPIEDEFTVVLPALAKIVHVGKQGQQDLCIWVMVSTFVKEERKFYLKGTGHEIPDDAEYIGTILDDPFVWHLFEKVKDQYHD